MTEPAIEAEVVAEEEDQPGAEMVPVEAPSTTLFRTDDPAEIVEKATAIANAIEPVLRKKQLVKRIGTRDFVQVEGWTFCGSMLGVFAVIEWTRPVENGWEARAEARTITGAVVGAAEAECLRSESKWKERDDYALRSMAQTRAVSKALRAPLGFIVQLAGFEATPAEEMDVATAAQPQVRRQNSAGGVPVPQNWDEIQATVRDCDNPDEAWPLFQAFLRATVYHLFGVEPVDHKLDQSALTHEQKMTFFQKAAGAAVWLREHEEETTDGPYRFYLEPTMRQAFASVLKGHALPIPDYVPPEPPAPEVDEEAERLAREALAGNGSPYD